MARASEQAPAKGAAGLQPPSFNAPDIVVAETDDAARFQTIDFKRSRTVYKSLYAPFISLLGRHYVDYDHKELPIFVVQAHLVTLSDMVFRGSRAAIGRHRASGRSEPFALVELWIFDHAPPVRG